MRRKARARVYTDTDWGVFNPILTYGEIGYSETSGKIKIGDGTKPWSDLPFVKPETSGLTTDQVSEGTRLYYTQGRFDSAFGVKNTSHLAEGSNLYYTQGRFDAAFAAKNSGHLAEGSNLYYTDTRADARIALQKGVANGLATLGANSKIPMGQMPDAMLGAAIYQGVWNASANTPAISSGVGSKGHYYVVEVPGTSTIDGISSWSLGDWIIFNGAVWQKVDNTDAVISVNGLIGSVSLTTTNINEGSNLYFTNSRARAVLIPIHIEPFPINSSGMAILAANYNSSTVIPAGLMVLSPSDYGFPEYSSIKASFIANTRIYAGGTGHIKLIQETAPDTYTDVAGTETAVTNTSLQFISSPEATITPNKKYHLHGKSGSTIQALDLFGACLKLIFFNP
jgi:hypothetical protein